MKAPSTCSRSLGAPAYKIASFEAVDLPLIAYVAAKRKPMIISTGMANLDEIGEAVRTAREKGCEEIVLLHCVSSYPAPDEQSNVRTVPDLAERFGVVAGLSDHTFGSAVAVASIALGGCVVEKHFTLARADGGPDSAFSLEPDEFKTLVDDCKRAWRALGKATYDLQGCERGSIAFRRSHLRRARCCRGREADQARTSARSGPAMALRPSICPMCSAVRPRAT